MTTEVATVPTTVTTGRKSRTYLILGIVFGLAGIVIALFVPASDVSYSTVEGISVFAVLYVLAQGVERVIEWIIDLATLVPGSPGEKKEAGIRTLSLLAAADEQPADAVVDAKVEADQGRSEISFLAHGLSILLAAVAVNWLNYGIFAYLGATGVDGNVDRLFTALAIAGSSKGLHELVGRLQKAKEKAEES